MAENTWTIAAPVKKFKLQRPNINGSPADWGTLRIRVNLNPITFRLDSKDNIIESNDIEVDIKLAFTEKEAKFSEYLANNLKDSSFVLMHSMKIAKVRRAEKVNDEWVEKQITGLTCSAKQVKVFDLVGDHFNSGIIVGKVSQETGAKLIVQESYRNVKSNTWEHRDVPVLVPDKLNKNTSYINKMIFCQGKVVGRTSDGTAKVYVLADYISLI